jgi:hypothetical protein
MKIGNRQAKKRVRGLPPRMLRQFILAVILVECLHAQTAREVTDRLRAQSTSGDLTQVNESNREEVVRRLWDRARMRDPDTGEYTGLDDADSWIVLLRLGNEDAIKELGEAFARALDRGEFAPWGLLGLIEDSKQVKCIPVLLDTVSVAMEANDRTENNTVPKAFDSWVLAGVQTALKLVAQANAFPSDVRIWAGDLLKHRSSDVRLQVENVLRWWEANRNAVKSGDFAKAITVRTSTRESPVTEVQSIRPAERENQGETRASTGTGSVFVGLAVAASVGALIYAYLRVRKDKRK